MSNPYQQNPSYDPPLIPEQPIFAAPTAPAPGGYASPEGGQPVYGSAPVYPAGVQAPVGSYAQPAYAQPAYGAPAGYGYVNPTDSAPKANWLQRVGSALLDYIIVPIPAFVIMLIGGLLADGGKGAWGAFGGLIVIAGYVVFIFIVFYNTCYRGGKGQSWGKQVLGTWLVDQRTGGTIGTGSAFARNLAHILDYLPVYLGYFWPLWDPQRQTFADKVCSTVVTTVPPAGLGAQR